MNEQTDGALAAQPRREGAPRHVRVLSAVLKSLMVAGIPLGPNRLVTIRGRASGLPRTTPLAVIRLSGRRWVWSPWGESQWVRNLRAAGRATIDERGRLDDVTAIELNPTERVGFFRDVLAPLARSIPGGFTFGRVVDGVDLHRPEEAAEGKVVFELHADR